MRDLLDPNTLKPRPAVASPAMEEAALNVAVNNYIAISKAEGAVAAAAFGVACGELMVTLNISLTVAALLLRTELQRRSIA